MRIDRPSDLGVVVRRRRRELRLTQQELAERLGVTRQWVIALEAGSGSPRLDHVMHTMAELSLALQITPLPTEDPFAYLREGGA